MAAFERYHTRACAKLRRADYELSEGGKRNGTDRQLRRKFPQQALDMGAGKKLLYTVPALRGCAVWH